MADFDSLFQDKQELVFRYLLRLTRDPVLAEELSQETFFRAYLNYAALREQDKAAAWLCRIAQNVFYAWYREQKKHTASAADADAAVPSCEDAWMQRELGRQAMSCLQALEEPYQTVFRLAVLHDIPLLEISRAFGKSESWARVTFYRAKKKLSERMQENHEL